MGCFRSNGRFYSLGAAYTLMGVVDTISSSYTNLCIRNLTLSYLYAHIEICYSFPVKTKLDQGTFTYYVIMQGEGVLTNYDAPNKKCYFIQLTGGFENFIVGKYHYLLSSLAVQLLDCKLLVTSGILFKASIHICSTCPPSEYMVRIASQAQNMSLSNGFEQYLEGGGR